MKKFSICLWVAFLALSSNIPSGVASSARETPVVNVVREWGPNVVNIGTEKVVLLHQHPFWGQYGNQMDAVARQFFAPQSVNAVKIKSVGSGVILNNEGIIVTNAHVVNMASKVYVSLSDGKSVEGTVLGIDQKGDLALVKIALPSPVKDMKLADTGNVMVGETVVAIGNPLGLENSVSVGVISGKSRFFQTPEHNIVMTDLLQTDAAINAGNSGGALLNLDGELIGVNLAVIQNASNIGFAVPADKIKAVLNLYREKSRQAQEQTQPGSISGV